MRFRFFSALVALALTGLGIASCTQDFDKFTPTGEPVVVGCPQGQKSCADVCVPADDAAYGCGSACDPCTRPNATSKCLGSLCAVDTCAPGFANCDGAEPNGCETATDSDPGNCGACDTVCSAPNAMGLCQGSACSVGPCNPGFSDCDAKAINGCESKLADDPANCGACGMPCNAFQYCNNGKCVNNPCGPGTADCNSDNVDGCETMLGTPESCMYCNQACTFANANGACLQGVCSVESCVPGWDDCDNMDGNGCEVDITAVSNCGACGNACPGGANAMATCTNGMCGIACAQGFADCNNNPLDGCEADLQSSAANCGSCGYACSNANTANLGCMNGMCAPTCANGFADCNTPAAPMMDDGCETSSGTDVLNCGACGRVCSGTNVASRSCNGGVCDSACDFGYANCNQPGAAADDGCEQLVQQSTGNCGSCGNTCTGALDCDRGPFAQKFCGCSVNNECGAVGTCNAPAGICTCGATICAPGEVCANNSTCQCNGGAGCGTGQTCCQSPAGCFDLTMDPNNCGACGRECPSGFVCNTAQPGAPSCRCNENTDCNLGFAGVCNMDGTCACGANQCAVGERCLADGTCG